MRAALIAAVLVLGVAGTASAASTPWDAPTPSTEVPTVETVTPDDVPSPPTTSEFGNETEIVIALDDDGNIVPG
jgi:hypothetical protein